jgi:hypothetical protein
VSVFLRSLSLVESELGQTYSLRHTEGRCCEMAHTRMFNGQMKRLKVETGVGKSYSCIKCYVSETAMWFRKSDRRIRLTSSPLTREVESVQ